MMETETSMPSSNIPLAQLKLEIKLKDDCQKEDLTINSGNYIKLEPVEQDEIHIKDEEEWNKDRHEFSPENLIKFEAIEPEVILKEEQDEWNKRRSHSKFSDIKINEDTGYYHCPDCPFRMYPKSGVKKHFIFRHKREYIIWYDCSGCPFRTGYKQTLIKHLELYNNHVVSKCFMCQYETENLNRLEDHQLEHIIKVKDEWLYCDQCDFKTKNKNRKATMKVHIMRKHKHIAFKCTYSGSP